MVQRAAAAALMGIKAAAWWVQQQLEKAEEKKTGYVNVKKNPVFEENLWVHIQDAGPNNKIVEMWKQDGNTRKHNVKAWTMGSA